MVILNEFIGHHISLDFTEKAQKPLIKNDFSSAAIKAFMAIFVKHEGPHTSWDMTPTRHYQVQWPVPKPANLPTADAGASS